MVRVIEARIRLPTFSIKHPEAFQVRASLPLPQPSTLVGVLAYCVGVAKGMGTDAAKVVGSWVEEGKLMAARASLLSGVPPMTVSTTVLRRFRVVDKAHLYKLPGEGPKYIKAIEDAVQRGEFERIKSMLEKDLTDAFYREYIMGHEVKCVWAISDDLELQPDWIMLAHRLGDTESLCAVLEVKEVGAKVTEDHVVETSFPTHLEGSKLIEGGPYTIMKMCDEAFFHHRKGKPRRFIIPCEITVKRIRSGVVPVITPSKVRVEYEEPVKVIKTDGGEEITAYTPTPTRRRGRKR